MLQNILVTGAAGFIGFHLCKQLLERGDTVVGIDNINDYYDPNLKYARLLECGIHSNDVKWFEKASSTKYSNFKFVRMNLEDKEELMKLCEEFKFDVIINLAAQAGVRYSILNPDAYVQSNLVGFLNILEASRSNNIKHLVYASSSSVYGMSKKMPFSVTDSVDDPISLYAATKKANELMAHTYSHLYKIPTTGLRFFTVYGPWGRPDMAYFLFADAIRAGKPINVFNHGKLKRDFTYIDDIVTGIINVADKPAQPSEESEIMDPSRSNSPYRVYNLGNNRTVELMDFIETLGDKLGSAPEMVMQDMQPGDVLATWANVDELVDQFNYSPTTPITEGLEKFVSWYKEYYK